MGITSAEANAFSPRNIGQYLLILFKLQLFVGFSLLPLSDKKLFVPNSLNIVDEKIKTTVANKINDKYQTCCKNIPTSNLIEVSANINLFLV